VEQLGVQWSSYRSLATTTLPAFMLMAT
jgi:hypothetical protein